MNLLQTPSAAPFRQGGRHRSFACVALPAVEASVASAQDYVSLATYWHTLLKRRWSIATVAIVVTTIVGIVSFKMQPIFKATARVQVESETPLIQSLEEMFEKAMPTIALFRRKFRS